MQVAIFKVLKDNYSYLLFNKSTAISIDPVDYEIINLALSKELKHMQIYSLDSLINEPSIIKRALLYSLTTHHHEDHSGGNMGLKNLLPNTQFIKNDEQKIILDDCTIQLISTPCHTKDSVCIYVKSKESFLFTGDTLFFLGCGRFFEGNADDMSKSLNKLVQLIDDNTILMYGHNYNVMNAKFVLKMYDVPKTLLEKQFLTFGEEKMYNPFLKQFSNPKELGKLRKFKDDFGLGSGK